MMSSTHQENFQKMIWGLKEAEVNTLIHPKIEEQKSTYTQDTTFRRWWEANDKTLTIISQDAMSVSVNVKRVE